MASILDNGVQNLHRRRIWIKNKDIAIGDKAFLACPHIDGAIINLCIGLSTARQRQRQRSKRLDPHLNPRATSDKSF
jgi:hypothetical protein